jgi:hypothetical protein
MTAREQIRPETTLSVAKAPAYGITSTRHQSLPDSVGNANDPGNNWQCWGVVRTRHGSQLTHPRQCSQNRQGARQKGGVKPRCCRGHARFEAEAQVLVATK